jgi:hypothetical protein
MSSPEGTSSTSWTALRDAIPVFDGTNAAITQKWLDGTEALFAPYPRHLGFRAAAARAKLAGAAATVMADYIEHDWLEFKVRLLRRFDPKVAGVAIQLEISSNIRYVGGSFMTAVDRAITDFEFLGSAFAVSILRGLALRVPGLVLSSIRFSPANDFMATITVFREMAMEAQMRADPCSRWATEADSMALAVTTGHGKAVEATPTEGPRSTPSKGAKRRARAKDKLHALQAQLDNNPGF